MLPAQKPSRVPHLLSPGALGAVAMPNCVIMAPMGRGRAGNDGTVPEYSATYFAQRASAGLLLTDGTHVSPQGVGTPATPGMWTEAHLEGWRHVVRAVHAAGGRIALQLLHAGRVSLTSHQPDGDAPVSSSAVRAATTMLQTFRLAIEPAPEPRALELKEMKSIVTQFALAARRAHIAGFDAVEIHASDGCLIDQFLRDGVNERHDRYGGSPENRARLLLDVTESVAKEMGADRTGVRLSPLSTYNDMSDRDPLTTFGTALRHLAALDLAWAHLAHMNASDLTHRLRDAYGKPLLLNGRFTADGADDAIRTELASAVSFGTHYIANPDLVERFGLGADLTASDPATWYGGGEHGYTDYSFLAPS